MTAASQAGPIGATQSLYDASAWYLETNRELDVSPCHVGALNALYYLSPYPTLPTTYLKHVTVLLM